MLVSNSLLHYLKKIPITFYSLIVSKMALGEESRDCGRFLFSFYEGK